MKKIVLVTLFLYTVSLFSPCCFGLKHYNRYLTIESDKSEITMTVGEQTRLRVSYGVFGVPTYKNLEYHSTNPFVVTVNNTGIANANMQGSAYITVTDNSGRTDSILIKVEKGRKSVIYPIIVLVFILSVIVVFKKIKPTSF